MFKSFFTYFTEINEINSHSRSVSTRCSSANSSNCLNRKSVPSFALNPNSIIVNNVNTNTNQNQIHINKTPAKRDSSLGKLTLKAYKYLSNMKSR